MKIAIASETNKNETRVAAVPESVRKFIALGAEVSVQSGVGKGSQIPDEMYRDVGATVAKSAESALKDADIVLSVRRPGADTLAKMKQGAVLVGMLEPYDDPATLKDLAKSGVVAFTMELLPRITRAQTMDVLSSQANLAGYRAVIDAAAMFSRALPMMMTAAGTVPAARAFVMGAGVAGLQAIATARRLGAVVTATDVRPAAKEQVESLGGKFVAVEDEEFREAETAGGYAKEMSKEYQAKQAELIAEHIAKQDMVITTALIPGRPAPRLITKAMLEKMKPGSVIVDLASERGGNVEGSKSDQVVTHKGVQVFGYSNAAGRIAASASGLYARNLYSFVETLIDKEAKSLNINWEDELVTSTALTRDGKVVHPAFSEQGE